VKRSPVAALVAAAWLVLVTGGLSAQRGGAVRAAEPPAGGAAAGGLLPVSLDPSTVRAAAPDLLALGRRVYEKECAACHGLEGRGDGEAAYLLYPKPRDFTAGRFALVSTWERVPTDEDLYRAISRGMPGSAMPSWGHLSEEARWGLVHHVKTFVPQPWRIAPAADPKDGSAGTGVIRVPPQPPFTSAARARALELYAEACASCHGPTGRGDGAEDQKDDRGYPTRPRDLTLGVFKGSPGARTGPRSSRSGRSTTAASSVSCSSGRTPRPITPRSGLRTSGTPRRSSCRSPRTPPSSGWGRGGSS
jgi:mono/diheme cytochrome c family protein